MPLPIFARRGHGLAILLLVAVPAIVAGQPKTGPRPAPAEPLSFDKSNVITLNVAAKAGFAVSQRFRLSLEAGDTVEVEVSGGGNALLTLSDREDRIVGRARRESKATVEWVVEEAGEHFITARSDLKSKSQPFTLRVTRRPGSPDALRFKPRSIALDHMKAGDVTLRTLALADPQLSNTAPAIHWDDDGKHLFYVDASGHLYRARFDADALDLTLEARTRFHGHSGLLGRSAEGLVAVVTHGVPEVLPPEALVFEPATLQMRRRLSLEGMKVTPQSVAAHPKLSSVVVPYDVDKLALLDLKDGKMVIGEVGGRPVGKTGLPLRSLAVTPDGKTLLARGAFTDNALYRMRMTPEGLRVEERMEKPGTGTYLRMSPDGKLFCMQSLQGAAQKAALELTAPEDLKAGAVQRLQGGLGALAFDARGRLYAIAPAEKRLLVFDLPEKGAAPRSVPWPHDRTMFLAPHPEGRYLIAIVEQGPVTLRETMAVLVDIGK